MTSLRTLISPTQLRERMQRQERRPLVVVDCRFDLSKPMWGRDAHIASHITGARYADLTTLLSGPLVAGVTGRHPLPDVATFIASAAALGISNDADVVAYDQGSGAFAARLWWLLRWIGHADVAVLDGGFAAWQAAGYEVVSGQSAAVTPALLEARPTLTHTINGDQLATAAVLLDARDPPRYRGDVEPIDARAGHIPGAINAPFAGNLTNNGDFKSPAELATRFAAITPSAQATPAPATVAVYCGSGVTACHNILAMVHAGLAEPALYPGSFSEWITNPTRAVHTGDQP